MEPIDERITAAQLMAMRDEPGACAAIGQLLGVDALPANLATRVEREIAEFVASGDAIRGSQLIHAAGVRRGRSGNSPTQPPPATPKH